MTELGVGVEIRIEQVKTPRSSLFFLRFTRFSGIRTAGLLQDWLLSRVLKKFMLIIVANVLIVLMEERTFGGSYFVIVFSDILVIHIYRALKTMFSR